MDTPDTKTPKPAEPRFPSNIPVVKPVEAVAGSNRPPHEDYKGKYIRVSDGELYAMAVVKIDPLGRTHKAMNSQHFWEGTKEQFEKAFYEEGKDKGTSEDEKTKKDFEAREKDRKETADEANKTPAKPGQSATGPTQSSTGPGGTVTQTL